MGGIDLSPDLEEGTLFGKMVFLEGTFSDSIGYEVGNLDFS